MLVAEPSPNEMEDLMRENQAQLYRAAEQLRLKNDFALPNEAGCMDRSAGLMNTRYEFASMSFQVGAVSNVNRAAG